MGHHRLADARSPARWPISTPRALVDDRKLHKLIRRTDLFGLYAAGARSTARASSRIATTLDDAAAAIYSDRTGVYVGSGGGNYQNQYDYFPLMTEADGDLPTFGRELANTVNPMWLLRTLPNNVLGHIGIRHGLKGPNACITNHSVGGTLAVIEAMEGAAPRRGRPRGRGGPRCADRAADGALLPPPGTARLRGAAPVRRAHDGSLFGEGAGALMLETEASAASRNAPVLGEVLGGGYALRGRRAGRDPRRRRRRRARDSRRRWPTRGCAGRRRHDRRPRQRHARSRTCRRRRRSARVFGAAMPPVTAFKWAFGHLIAAAGIVDAVLALAALTRRRGARHRDAVASSIRDCAGLPVSAAAQAPRSDVALILCRGFAGTNAALVVRAA